MTTLSCSTGVYDCSYSDASFTTCADYDGIYIVPDEMLWLVISAGFIMCGMAFGIGANDVANAWGTSVGSGAIDLWKATLIAGFANWAGATLLGAGVSDKIEKGVSRVANKHCWACGYCDSQMSVYSAGMLGALFGTACFLGLATFTKMPVSTTHAMVGGVVGMTVTALDWSCLNWDFEDGLSGIIASWIISPLLAGIIGVVAFVSSKRLILDAENPRERGEKALPGMYGAVTFVMVFLIMIKAPATAKASIGVQLGVAVGLMVISVLVAHFGLLPYVREQQPSKFYFGTAATSDASNHSPIVRHDQIDNVEMETSSREITDTGEGGKEEVARPVEEANTRGQEDAIFCFKYLLVFNAMLESFAHG